MDNYKSMLWWLENAQYWFEQGQRCDKWEEFVSHSLRYAIEYAKECGVSGVVSSKGERPKG